MSEDVSDTLEYVDLQTGTCKVFCGDGSVMEDGDSDDEKRKQAELERLYADLEKCRINLQLSAMNRQINDGMTCMQFGGYQTMGFNPFSLASEFGFLAGTQAERKATKEEKEHRYEQITKVAEKTREALNCVDDYYKFRAKMEEIKDIINDRYVDEYTKRMDKEKKVKEKFGHAMRVAYSMVSTVFALGGAGGVLALMVDKKYIAAIPIFIGTLLFMRLAIWLFANASED